MDEKHKELAEDVLSKASFRLTENGSVTPIFIAILPDNNELMPIVITGIENLSLDEYAVIATNAAAQIDAVAMMLICEQWVAKVLEDEPMLASIAPSQHPDKMECLAVIYMTATGECSILTSEIHKDPSGTKYTKDSVWLNDASVLSGIVSPWKV